MPIYISSSGEEKDTATMATPYLISALAKAQREGNQDNIDACQQELTDRSGGADTTVAPDDQGLSPDTLSDDIDEAGNFIGTTPGADDGFAPSGNYVGTDN